MRNKTKLRNLYFIFIFIIFSLCFLSCFYPSQDSDSSSYLILKGDEKKSVILYEIPADKENGIFIPLKKINMNTITRLPAGNYLITNICSKHDFQIEPGERKTIYLGKVNAMLNCSSEENKEQFSFQCQDPIDNSPIKILDKNEVDILPGQNSIIVSGRKIDVSFKNHPNYYKIVNLAPLMLSSSINSSNDFFFVYTDAEGSDSRDHVISGKVNEPMWLVPGEYKVEINGTSMNVNIHQTKKNKIKLGAIKVKSPSHLNNNIYNENLNSPYLVKLSKSVLLTLNESYNVFPGQYRLEIEDSRIRKVVNVLPNVLSTIETEYLRISYPEMSDDEHHPYFHIYQKGQHLYAYKTQIKKPFLIFKGESYFYSVVGLRGIFAKLNTDSKISLLSKLILQWEKKYSQVKVRTELVKIEGKKEATWGRSLDLIKSKPNELYLPPGGYSLSYFSVDKTGEKHKVKRDFSLRPGEQKNLMIPLYFEKRMKNKEDKSQEENDSYKYELKPLSH